MAEQKEHRRRISGSDPRQHNTTSTGRGESGSAREETVKGERQASTGSGRSSNESDARDRMPPVPEKPGNEGLTMGTNGGERIGAAPEQKRPESHKERRKAS